MRIYKLLTARKNKSLIFSLIMTAGLLLVQILPSHATVDWTDGFEYSSYFAMNPNPWQSSCPTDDTVLFPTTERKFSGSKSLKMVFRGQQGTSTRLATPGYKSCFITRNFNAPSETVFTRWYMYMENFAINNTSTKVTRVEMAGVQPGIWWLFMFGSPVLAASVEGIVNNAGQIATETVYGGTLPQNQWVCVETQQTMSTPGVDNGIVRQWINGTQTLNKTNQRMRSATVVGSNGPNGKFQTIKIYVQDGLGNMYLDDYAVSRDARIGCSGSTPSSDTTAPQPPTGVR